MIDRRRHPRVRVKVRLEVSDLASGRLLTLHTTDLSAGGARCTGLSGLPCGSSFEGRLYLPLSEGGRDVDVPIDFGGTLLRAEGDGAAIEFERMSEADRDEIRRFLFTWMADDSLVHPALAEAI